MENHFAKNLKMIREKKGLSQSELSRKTKKICEDYNATIEDDKDKLSPITQASIARWEAGENSPSVDNLVLLKTALGVDLVDLIGKDFDNIPTGLASRISLELFLSETDYFDIDEKIKNDKNLDILEFLSADEIILHIYSDDRLEMDNKLCTMYEQEIQEYHQAIKNLNKKKSYPNKFNDLLIAKFNKPNPNRDFFAKMSKIYVSIKKYYSKQQILLAIDRQIDDEDYKNQYSEEERIDRVIKCFDYILQKVKERKKEQKTKEEDENKNE